MRHWACVAVLAALLSGQAAAQQFPTRPIKVLVSIPPGGAPDLAARLLAQRLTETIGQAVYVENRPGANGNLAGEALANAAPDGYTLMLAGDSMVVINPHIYAKMPFDTLKDIVPVSSIASNQFFISVNPKLPVKTLPEFVEHARKANPPLFYASGGNGSQHQLGMEMFKQRAGINLVHVPYRGGGPALIDLLGGQVQVMFPGTTASIAYIKSGRLRPLAVTTATRSQALPDVPTVGDFVPGYEASAIFGLGAPRDTPVEIVDRLNREINAAFRDPTIRARITESGASVLAGSPAEFGALIADEIEKWAKVVKFSGAKAD
jgi:tripartite-type tricarboxylate transporter receptor subunit TctC